MESFFALICDPDLVREGTALTLLVQESTEAVCARSELAGNLEVCEWAVGHLAFSTISAGGLAGVLECAVRIGAVGEELAVLLALVGRLVRWGRVSADTFPVFASGSKRADVGQINRSVGRSHWRLVSKLAVPVLATQVESADGLVRVGRFTVGLCHLDVLALWGGLSLVRCSRLWL